MPTWRSARRLRRLRRARCGHADGDRADPARSRSPSARGAAARVQRLREAGPSLAFAESLAGGLEPRAPWLRLPSPMLSRPREGRGRGRRRRRRRASRFAARRTCRVAGPTAATAGAAATSSSSATRRAATSRRCAARRISARGAAATAQGKQRHGARGDDEVGPGAAGDPGRGPRGRALRPGRARAAGGRRSRRRRAGTATSASPPRPARRRGSPSAGSRGESGWIELRLKLLADAGLVGLPNAGKSSLLGRLTRAAPKVADYPFTTLEPVLGTIDDGERQLVLADIPGLIEGAAEGAGLGHEFLAHVERCRALVHLVALGRGYATPRRPTRRSARELAAHGGGLDALPELVVLSKRDLLPDEEVEASVAEWRRAARRIGARRARDLVGDRRRPRRAPRRDLRRRPVDRRRGARAGSPPASPSSRPSTSSTRPAGRRGLRRRARGDRAFRVAGRGVEMLVARHDLSNLEALAYLEQRLREIGVIAALERAGFEPGDEVRIGDEEFELDPG